MVLNGLKTSYLYTELLPLGNLLYCQLQCPLTSSNHLRTLGDCCLLKDLLHNWPTLIQLTQDIFLWNLYVVEDNFMEFISGKCAERSNHYPLALCIYKKKSNSIFVVFPFFCPCNTDDIICKMGI